MRNTSVDSRGTYRVVDDEGRVHTGRVAALLQDEIRRVLRREGEGPTGKLRFDTHVYDVRAGIAYLNEQPAGTVNPHLDFDLDAGRGNANHTIGAVWLGAAAKNPGSGTIDVVGQQFRAIDGAIFHQGLEIGWLDGQGHFRGVTPEGDFFEGTRGGAVSYLFRV